jgi:prophage tail gpP-like protein
MSSPYQPATPDKQQIRLRVMDERVDLTRWTSYSFASHFLTPADGWSMTLGDGDLDERQRNALRVGARVRLYVDDFPLSEGYIDVVEVDAAFGRGVTYNVQGRDRLGAVVDAIADPRVQFKSGTTLAEFLKQLLAPFGWVSDEHFETSNDANRDAKTGGVRGIPTPKKKTSGGGSSKKSRKKKKSGRLSTFVLYQMKPHDHEGLFRFIHRVVERHGLWVWCSADGEKLIVDKPDFEQEPRYVLRRKNDGSSGHDDGTNILRGSVRRDSTDQSSIIVADGFSGGGEFGRGKIKSYCVNPYFGLDEQGFPSDDVVQIISRYPEAEPVLFVSQTFPKRAPRMPPRPMFLHDEESKTQDQLNFFVKRTMSELLRKSLVCHYTVEGHGQTFNGEFTPWDIDTVVDVQDDVGDVHERMYVIGRTFEKSRSGGTHTNLELVRLYSIASGDQSELQSKSGLVDNTKKAA